MEALEDSLRALAAPAVPLAAVAQLVTRLAAGAAAHSGLQAAGASSLRIRLQHVVCDALLRSLQASSDGGTTAERVALAGVWRAAAGLLVSMYSWQEEEVVIGFIGFWEGVCATMRGDWPSAAGGSIGADRPDCVTDGGRAPAAVAAQRPPAQDTEGTAHLARYAAWLTRWVGRAALSEVVSALDSFLALTHVCPLRLKAPTAQLQMLLMYAQVWCGGDVSAALTRTAAVVLRLGPWQPLAAGCAADAVAAVMSAGAAFTAACALLQAAAADNDKARSSDGLPSWYDPARAAGALLQAAYGWHAVSTRGDRRSASRPCGGTPYDACMLQLLHGMMEWPSEQSLSIWDAFAHSGGFRALAAVVCSHDHPALLVRGLVALVLHDVVPEYRHHHHHHQQQQRQQQQQQQKQGQQEQPTATTRRCGMAAEDREALQRCTTTLRRVYLWQAEALAAQPGGVVNAPAASAAAAAGSAAALLQGAAELLRPAANCGAVEWRLAALDLMASAAEAGGAILTGMARRAAGTSWTARMDLWREAALEGLLYALDHDPSLRVRRAAVRLAQHVVLPAGSPGAGRLVRTLVRKARDRDRGVAGPALELVAQLTPAALAGCLEASDWCRFAQTALAALAPLPSGGSGPAPPLLSAAGRRQLLQLLREVLLQDGGGSGPTAHPPAPGDRAAVGRWLAHCKAVPVGMPGCRVLLLLMLRDASTAEACEQLARSLQDAAAPAGAGMPMALAPEAQA